MQNLSECKYFFKNINKKDVKLSVNIGHLNLASKVYKFDKINYLKSLKNYIETFELSHNNGFQDLHKPLINNAWYWEILKSKIFREKTMILEYRNVSIAKIKESIKLFNKKMNFNE